MDSITDISWIINDIDITVMNRGVNIKNSSMIPADIIVININKRLVVLIVMVKLADIIVEATHEDNGGYNVQEVPDPASIYIVEVCFQ